MQHCQMMLGCAEPPAQVDRGRYLGFSCFNVFAGGPGNLAVPLGQLTYAKSNLLSYRICPWKGRAWVSALRTPTRR
jgi:hypothetical protein